MDAPEPTPTPSSLPIRTASGGGAAAGAFLRAIDLGALRRLVVFGFGLRLLLWAISSGSGEIRGWSRIGAQVAAHGVRRFSTSGLSTRQSPVAAMWAGAAHSIATELEAPFELVFKVLPLLADAALLTLIIAVVRRRGGTALDAWRAGAIYATALAVVWTTSHHGGLDSVLACCALLAVVLVDEGDRPILAGLALAAAIHMHMAAVALLPALWLLQARSLRQTAWFSLAVAIGLSPLALPLSAKGQAFIERALNLETPSNRWGLQFLFGEGSELPIVGHFVELIGGRVQAESFTLVLLASVVIGVQARLRHRSGLETGALVVAALLVLTPSIGLPYAALPLPFLVVIDLRRSLIYSAASGAFLTLAYLGFAKAEMPLVTNHSTPIGFFAGLCAFCAWLVLLDVLVQRLRPARAASGPAAPSLMWERALLPLVFVVVATPMGAALALATPPFQVADEPLHAMTACALAEGQLRPEHDAPPPWTTTLDVPADLVVFNRAIAALKLPHQPERRASVPDLLDAARLPHDPSMRHISTREETREMGVYPPAMYGPQALACAVGRAAQLRPWALLSAMRLANLAAFILLGALALWVLPTGREAVALLLLTPMALSSGASASADGQLIPLVALWLAVIFRIAARPNPQPLPVVAIFGAVVGAFALSLAKSVYVPLALAFILLPRGCFTSLTHRLVATTLVVGASVLGAVVWIPETGGGLDAWAAKAGLEPAATLTARLEAPFTFALAALRTFFRERILTGVVGTLGWRDTVLPFSAFAVFWAAFVPVTLLGGGARSSWRRGVGVIVLGVGAVFALLLFYALYFTKPDARWVSDVQGRHFLPGLIFVSVGLAEYLGLDMRRRGRRSLAVVVGVVAIFILVQALGAVQTRYYLDAAQVPEVMRAAFQIPAAAPSNGARTERPASGSEDQPTAAASDDDEAPP